MWRVDLTIVYSDVGNVFYQNLAHRLAAACREKSRRVRLCTATDLVQQEERWLQGEKVALVNPWDCFRWVANKEGLSTRLAVASKKLMVLAEAVETSWFQNQLRLPVSYDVLIDVGFISQEHKAKDFGMPYRFLFNGPTAEEELVMMRYSKDASDRPLAWAMVGHQTTGRVELATRLAQEIHSGGFVFLPNPGRGVRKGAGAIGPEGLHAVLKKSRYYVWESHHEFDYYESFRFLEAIIAGAVPCKVDRRAKRVQGEIPGIFASVRELSEHIQKNGFSTMRHSAEEYYLSSGRLADHVREVLEGV